MKSGVSEECRYFVPSSLTASQTTKAAAKVRRRILKPDPLTYAKLLADQALAITHREVNSQTGANRATALRLFLRANHLHLDDVVGLEMRPHFPLAMDRLAELLLKEGKSARAISNTRALVTPWKSAVIADDTDRALLASRPTPFVEALRATISGHPVERVARQCGIPRDMLVGWLRGKIPRASNASNIRRVEVFFGRDRNSLVTLAGIVDGVRATERVGEAPPLDFRSRQVARSKSRYCLVPPKNSPLRDQWMAHLQFKTAIAIQRPMRRHPNGRWTVSGLTVIKQSDANWATFFKGSEVPTAKVAWAQTSAYLGWLGLSPEKGGAGLSQEVLQTLAWLLIPRYVLEFLEWLKKRCGGRRSKSTVEFLSLVACHVRPNLGFLYQSPELLATLPLEYQGTEWHEMCSLQHDYVSQLKIAFGPEIVSSRDSFEPIRSVIDLAEPLEAIADMVQRMRRDRPHGAPTLEAVWARDIFLVKLFVSNPLRKRNMASLTWAPENVDGYRPDDRGSLYQRVDGSWRICVPKHLLKNRRCEAIKDYDAPVHSSVWRDLERYLLRHREDLLRWPTDLVFLTTTRDPKGELTCRGLPYKKAAPTCHVPYMEMSKKIFALTERYLWKSMGIGTHAFRHIVVTSILKADGGDIKTAALVLNDSEETVSRHYSGMRSGDGAVRMGQLLGKTMNRM